jgi:predicted metal-dependent phosphoesterase TrpH
MRVDFHLHSVCSDGELAPAALVKAVRERGLTGLSLTDHNGIWGVDVARAAAQQEGLFFMEGIEISTSLQGIDAHILGYSERFDRQVLRQGLATTREGYAQRMQMMMERCRAAGWDKLSWDSLVARRRAQDEPVYVLFDLVVELAEVYHLPWNEAKQTVMQHGYVGYGDWAPTPAQAVRLIHQAGGVAVLAHGGLIVTDHSEDHLQKIMQDALRANLDGLEVRHPNHDAQMVSFLQSLASKHSLVLTAGSDWHGSTRSPLQHEQFGILGMEEVELQRLRERLHHG